MISAKKYIRAKEVVSEYESNVNKSIIKDYVCSICKKVKIKAIDKQSTLPTHQDMGLWGYGAVAKVNFGYGSRNDTESFYIAICDDCIEKLEEDEFALNLNDVKNDIKKYKLI